MQSAQRCKQTAFRGGSRDGHIYDAISYLSEEQNTTNPEQFSHADFYA